MNRIQLKQKRNSDLFWGQWGNGSDETRTQFRFKIKMTSMKTIKWHPQAIPVRYYVLAGKANHIALRIKNDGLPWYLVGCHQIITIAFIYHARHCTKHFTYTPFTGNRYGHNIKKRRSQVSNPWPPDSKTCAPTQIV